MNGMERKSKIVEDGGFSFAFVRSSVRWFVYVYNLPSKYYNTLTLQLHRVSTKMNLSREEKYKKKIKRAEKLISEGTGMIDMQEWTYLVRKLIKTRKGMIIRKSPKEFKRYGIDENKY